MRVTIVGCSGSFAGPTSPAACYLVRTEYEGRTWNVALDLGSGALGALQRHLDPRDLDAVVLSHLHPDHYVDVCGLFVIQKHHPDGPSERLPVHAPAGAAQRLTQVCGFEDGTGLERYFRFADLVDGQPFVVGPFTITPYAVLHPVPAYGIRVKADGVVLAYTGDTDRCAALGPLMTGADLVLADSAFVEGRDTATGVHMNGAQCAAAAVAAGGVGRLMLTHIPVWNDPQVCRSQAAAQWPGEVELAEPDRTYDLSP